MSVTSRLGISDKSPEFKMLTAILRNQVVIMEVNHRMMAKSNVGNFEYLSQLEERILDTKELLGGV